MLKVEEGRYLASRIPGATFVELPGIDHLPFVGDQDALLSAVEEFLSRGHRARPDGALATVIAVAARGPARSWICCGGSSITNASFSAADRCRGCEPLAASFDGPGRAVQCALSVVGMARQSRIDARAGVHIGAFDAAQADEPVSSGRRDRGRRGEHESRVADRHRSAGGLGITFDDRGRSGPLIVRWRSLRSPD